MLVNYSRAIKNTGFYLLALIVLLPDRVARAYDFNENSGLDTTATGGGYKDTVLNSAESIDITIANIITFILSLVGIAFMFLIIIAGIRWMFAAGDEEKVSKSKKTIQDAMIGLFIVFGAYAVVWLVMTLVAEQSLLS